jgi:hypothetical protein
MLDKIVGSTEQEKQQKTDKGFACNSKNYLGNFNFENFCRFSMR